MADQPFVGPTDQNALGRSLFLDQIKPVSGVGMAAAVLIGVATVLNAVNTWSDWHRYNVLNDFMSGGSVTIPDLEAADDLAVAGGVVSVSGLVGAAVVLLVWLWRARQNAEIICMAHHRRARGWVIGSWVCPVVNLWFPFMIVDDVYRASRPDNPRDLVDLRGVLGSKLLGWWWALWLGANIASWAGIRSLRGEPSVDSFHNLAIWSTVDTVLLAGAAVLIIRAIRVISAWQTPRWPS